MTVGTRFEATWNEVVRCFTNEPPSVLYPPLPTLHPPLPSPPSLSHPPLSQVLEPWRAWQRRCAVSQPPNQRVSIHARVRGSDCHWGAGTGGRSLLLTLLPIEELRARTATAVGDCPIKQGPRHTLLLMGWFLRSLCRWVFSEFCLLLFMRACMLSWTVVPESPLLLLSK